jgi:hypothetical protein
MRESLIDAGIPLSTASEAMSGAQVGDVRRVLVAHRLVQAGILVTLLWKWSFFLFASQVYQSIPLDDPFFPNWLRSIFVLRVAFLAAAGSVALSLVTGNQSVRRSCAWIIVFSLTVMCVHQGSYNDMTFVTAWWTALWSLWFVHRMEKDDESTLLRKGAFLSRLIISVILLGGGLGKWTGEYWSGEVFYDIYFRDRDYWVFNLLRSWFEPETLRVMSTWYSRQVVVIETLAGVSLWLLPPRWAAAIGVVVLTMIAVLSNTLLFSVLTCLIALAAVGFLVRTELATDDHGRRVRLTHP